MASKSATCDLIEYEKLIEAATAVGMPDPSAFVNKIIFTCGASVIAMGHDASGKTQFAFKKFTKDIFDIVANGIIAWDQEHFPLEADVIEPADAPPEIKESEVDLSSIFGTPSEEPDPVQSELVESPPPTEHSQQVPERTFDHSKAVFDQEGELLNEEECWVIAGMQPPMTIQDETDKLKFIVRVIRHLQNEIDDIALSAKAEIATRASALNSLDHRFGQAIKAAAIPLLPKGKKSIKNFAPGAGIYFRKTGGPKVHDRDEIAAWLIKQDDDTLALLKAEWKLNFDVRDLYPHAIALKIPGISVSTPNEHGKMSIGPDKAWSPKKAKDTVGGALECLKRIGGQAEESEE